jgi:hypothetical protein
LFSVTAARDWQLRETKLTTTDVKTKTQQQQQQQQQHLHYA